MSLTGGRRKQALRDVRLFDRPVNDKLRTAVVAVGAVAALLLFLAVAAWLLGSKLVSPANHTVALPTGFSAQTVSIPGVGHSIAGWWVDQGNGSPVVLLLHAVRADRSTMVSRAQLLMQHGFSVLLIDLQGQGETPGEAITLGFRESADVVAARDWIKSNAPGRKVGVIGCSLGGASVLLAPQPAGFNAVVLEAVYPRISQAVENRIRIRLGPLAPVLSPLLLMQIEPRLHIAASDLEPIRSIGRLGAPVLIVAGSKDQHTTLEESQELFDAASNPKSLWIVEGARHQDLLAYDKQGYEEHVVGFLSAILTPTSPAENEVRETGANALPWVPIDKADEDGETFVDPSSIRIEGAIRRGSSTVVVAPHSQSGAGQFSRKWVDHITYQFAFNCEEGMSRVEGFRIFFDDGTHYIDPKGN
jgi:alpha-beta hydrolase superfamily lysophospholipase